MLTVGDVQLIRRGARWRGGEVPWLGPDVWTKLPAEILIETLRGVTVSVANHSRARGHVTISSQSGGSCQLSAHLPELEGLTVKRQMENFGNR